MSDMEERKKFEEAFKDAFDNASVEPSENVWLSIELSLAKEESNKMKRTVLLYQLLAAASMAFALLSVGFGIFDKSDNQPQWAVNATHPEGANSITDPSSMAAVNSHAIADVANHEESKVHPDQGTNGNGLKNSEQPFIKNSSSRNSYVANNNISNTATHHYTGSIQEGDKPVQKKLSHGLSASNSIHNVVTALNSAQLPSKVNGVDINRSDNKTVEVDPVVMMFAALQEREKALQIDDDHHKKETFKDNLWTSVAFAAGGYNGGQHMSSPRNSVMMSQSRLSQNLDKTMDRQINASGVTYSYGVGVGKRISDKWILQGGVSYLTHNSNYMANSVLTADYENFDAISLTTVKNNAEKMVLSSSEYNVNNSAQYLSLPVQAGYLLMNKKVSIQVNAGVSTDMFLKSIITPDSDGVEKTVEKRGDDSPYRSVNFSGLFGTELGYKLGDHYQLAINPGLRYPFNSIYKSELNVSSAPMTFDVGLKVRYIFQ
jgi:hypothetical protein